MNILCEMMEEAASQEIAKISPRLATRAWYARSLRAKRASKMGDTARAAREQMKADRLARSLQTRYKGKTKLGRSFRRQYGSSANKYRQSQETADYIRRAYQWHGINPRAAMAR